MSDWTYNWSAATASADPTATWACGECEQAFVNGQRVHEYYSRRETLCQRCEAQRSRGAS